MKVCGGEKFLRRGLVFVLCILSAPFSLSGCNRSSSQEEEQQQQQSSSVEAAPQTLVMKTLDGKPVTLDQYKGQVVLLDVWASWCATCVEALPWLNALHQKYQTRGFSVVGISIDDGGRSSVENFIESYKLSYPMLLDSDKKASVTQILGITSLPTVFLVDVRGTMIARWTGKSAMGSIEAAVINALEDGPGDAGQDAGGINTDVLQSKK